MKHALSGQSRVNPERVTPESLLERARKIQWRASTVKAAKAVVKAVAKLDIAK